MKTELRDRTLWYDGTVQVTPERVPELLLSGVPLEKIVVEFHNDDTKLFNSLDGPVISDVKLKNAALDMTWKIPKKYAGINLGPYLMLQLASKFPEPGEQRNKYITRLKAELEQVELRGMDNLLRALIFVVDEFKRTNTVWGVGRGSSCASLVLFLIGLHKVDPIKYNIPLEEFFHD